MDIASKKIDIITPVYNKEKEISSFLNSIKHLEQEKFNIIFVDDGSTDNTVNIIRNNTLNNKNIFLFQKKNGGVSSARNYGIKLSQSEYIWFCDPDDEIITDNIDYLLKCLEFQCDCYILDFKQFFYSSNSELLCSYNYQGEKKFSEIKQDVLDNRVYSYKDPTFLSTPWDKVFKRSKVNFEFDENVSVYEDQIFNFEYFFGSENIEKIYFINLPLYKYKIYINSTSLSHNWNDRKTEDFFYFCRILNQKYDIDTSGIVCREANHILKYTYGFKNKLNTYQNLKKRTNTKILHIEYLKNEFISYLLIFNIYFLIKSVKHILKGK